MGVSLGALPRSSIRFPGWFLALALLLTSAALAAGRSRGLPTAELLRAAPGILLLLAGYFALSDSSIRELLASRRDRLSADASVLPPLFEPELSPTAPPPALEERPSSHLATGPLPPEASARAAP